MKFTFSLATPGDDAELRQLLANNTMPGRITVTFEREPSYFLGCGTMGRFWQVVIARDPERGDLAGVICRAISAHFVNGEAQSLGYIGQLRVDHPYRGLWMLSQGIPYLHTLHQDGLARAYFAAISDENRVARGVLVDRRRPGFPQLQELAHIVTLGIILRKRIFKVTARRNVALRGLSNPRSGAISIRRGSASTLPAIVAFLQREGAKKQFFPAYTEADFTTRDTIPGFDVGDFFVAYTCGTDFPAGHAQEEDTIVGVLGLWDQSGYKQSVVQGYSGSLRWLRPLYNVGARITGAQPLPGIGEHIKSAYASFICIQDDDPVVFQCLLRDVYDLAASRGYAYLMLGLTCQDPLLSIAQAYPHIAYYSRLYTVCWEDAGDFHAQLDGRVPYVEIAAL
ncbi:MAG: hypothetical protein JXA33_08955 [Anaerolineae bacterium]|nr:hypothetical protein [Anaerolineae bacterium]